MTAGFLLFGYAALVVVAGPRLLGRGGWTERAPMVGIIAWQALTTTVIVSVVLAGFALVAPAAGFSAALAGLLDACIAALRCRYTRGGAVTAAAGAAAALLVLSRAAWCVTASFTRSTGSRAGHRDTLALVGTPIPRLGVTVIDHAEPAVYCLPGRNRRTVVTTGALRVLDDRQLAAALAHERAHLEQRHDLILAWSGGLAGSFPRLPLFTRAHTETLRLVELLADDVAARTAERLTLAEALLNLAGGRTPDAALGAGGSTAAARVRRLIAPHRPLGRTGTALAITAVAVVLAIPLVGLFAPAFTGEFLHYCPPGTAMTH